MQADEFYRFASLLIINKWTTEMATSKLVTLAADGLTATVADAAVSDIFTTIIDPDAAVTGLYGFGQSALLVFGGMAIQNNRLGRGWNPLNV